MKTTVIISFLTLTVFSATAQIERKPVTIKTDSTQTGFANNKADNKSRKDRFRELDLTREQRSKLKEIGQANKAAKEAIQNNEALTDMEKKKQVHQLQKAQLEKIQAILTPEQFEKFKASRQNNP